MTSIHKFVLAVLIISISTTHGTFADPMWKNVGVLRPTSIARDTSGMLYATGVSGVWKSTNNGNSWQLITSDPGLADGFAIIVNPITNDVIVAVEPGVYRSQDGGINWTRLDIAIVGLYALGVRSDGLIVGAGSPGGWRSTNNGDTWTKTLTTLGPLHNGIAFSKTGVAFVVTLLNGLYRSTNDGVTWQNVSAGFADASNVEDVVCDTVHGYVYATAYHQFFQDPTYNKVFRSTDDGLTWGQVDSVGGISLSMGVDALGNVFSGRSPTVYSTDHGMSWIDIASGVQQGDRLVEFTAAGNGRMLLADMDDSLKSADFGSSFVCGDADGNGSVNISDAVFLIAYIFGGGAAPDPIEAGDANLSGDINISDAVYLIQFIFAGGAAPCSQ